MRIVTDSSADIPEGWERSFDIDILPINIQFGEKTYQQGVDLSYSQFYQLVRELKMIPKTSLPSPEQIQQYYQKIARVGETILSIHLSSKLSGTYSAVKMAAQNMTGTYCVVPFDSLSGSAALAFMCREARQMEQRGATLQEILERLEFIRRKITIIFTLETLEFAHLSGRINSLQALLSSVLQIKPIVVLRDGLLHIGDKVRTRGKALDRVIVLARERFGDRLVNLAVVHANDPAIGEAQVNQVRQRFNIKQLVLTDLSISVAAHLGPGAVGIVAYPEEGS